MCIYACHICTKIVLPEVIDKGMFKHQHYEVVFFCGYYVSGLNIVEVAHDNQPVVKKCARISADFFGGTTFVRWAMTAWCNVQYKLFNESIQLCRHSIHITRKKTMSVSEYLSSQTLQIMDRLRRCSPVH